MGLTDPKMVEIYQQLIDDDPNWKNALHDIFQSLNDAMENIEEDKKDETDGN